MTIIEGLTLCKILLKLRPNGNLTGIGKQHADDGSFLGSLLYGEQSLARYPSIGNSLVVGLTLTLAYNYIETIIPKVACLTRTLNTISDNSDCLVLQNLTSFLQRKLFLGDNIFYNATKIHFCHKLILLKTLYVKVLSASSCIVYVHKGSDLK